MHVCAIHYAVPCVSKHSSADEAAIGGLIFKPPIESFETLLLPGHLFQNIQPLVEINFNQRFKYWTPDWNWFQPGVEMISTSDGIIRPWNDLKPWVKSISFGGWMFWNKWRGSKSVSKLSIGGLNIKPLIIEIGNFFRGWMFWNTWRSIRSGYWATRVLL